MILKTILSIVLMATTVHASVQEFLPKLASDDLAEQTQARLDLFSVCSNTGRAGAEEERKAVCLEICQALQNKLPMTSMFSLIRNLERIGGEESVPTLVQLMGHSDERVRDDARRALSMNPSDAAAQALGAQLKSRKARSAETTAGLIYGLGERKQAGSSKLITGSLKSKNQEVFIAAVKTLGALNEDAGVKALFERQSMEEGFRKMQIEAALFSTGRKAVYEALYADGESAHVRSTALLGLILQGDTGKSEKAMTSGDVALQLAVIEAALQGKDPKVYDAVAQHIGSLPSHIQLQALGALEFSGNRDYATSVEPLLKSSDIFVQDNASRALARIGTADSVAFLMANGRGDARRALGQLNVEGVDAELEKIAGASSDVNSRAVAIDALAIRGRQDLIPIFLKYAAADDGASSTAAIKAVGSIGNLSHVEALTDLMIAKEASPVSRDALNAIVAIMRRSTTPGKAVDVLVLRMNSASPRSKANMLQALVQSGSKEALEPIVEACNSSDEKLQKQAIKLLGGWQDMNGIPAMLEMASDDSMSLANHVTLMRGVSRLYAGGQPWKLKKADVQKAIDVCRRPEEKEALQATLKKLK